MYEPAGETHDPMMDTYASESVRSQLLGGGKQHRRVSSPLCSPAQQTFCHTVPEFMQS